MKRNKKILLSILAPTMIIPLVAAGYGITTYAINNEELPEIFMGLINTITHYEFEPSGDTDFDYTWYYKDLNYDSTNWSGCDLYTDYRNNFTVKFGHSKNPNSSAAYFVELAFTADIKSNQKLVLDLHSKLEIDNNEALLGARNNACVEVYNLGSDRDARPKNYRLGSDNSYVKAPEYGDTKEAVKEAADEHTSTDDMYHTQRKLHSFETVIIGQDEDVTWNDDFKIELTRPEDASEGPVTWYVAFYYGESQDDPINGDNKLDVTLTFKPSVVNK